MTFETKLITTSFTGGLSSFSGTVESLRISARIEALGGEEGLNLSMAIYGMPLSQMNALSVAGRDFGKVGDREIQVYAGGSVTGLSLIFSGIITYAWIDAQAMPQVCFRVEAKPGAKANVQPTEPTSVKGEADAQQLLGQLAGKGGFGFSPGSGCSVKLRNPYLWGSVGSQIKQLVRMAGLEHVIENKVLAAWAPNQSRGGGGVNFVIGDWVAAPAFDHQQVLIKAIFDKGRNCRLGEIFTISGSMITPANGSWKCTKIIHEIESNMPNGKWFSIILGTPEGAEAPPSQ